MWTYRARPLRVIDGDTLDVLLDLGFHVHVTIRLRLVDVDTPERNEPGWAEARDALRELIVWSPPEDEWPLVVHTLAPASRTPLPTGGFGRWLGVVSRPGQDGSINAAMAASSEEPPDAE